MNFSLIDNENFAENFLKIFHFINFGKETNP